MAEVFGTVWGDFVAPSWNVAPRGFLSRLGPLGIALETALIPTPLNTGEQDTLDRMRVQEGVKRQSVPLEQKGGKVTHEIDTSFGESPVLFKSGNAQLVQPAPADAAVSVPRPVSARAGLAGFSRFFDPADPYQTLGDELGYTGRAVALTVSVSEGNQTYPVVWPPAFPVPQPGKVQAPSRSHVRARAATNVTVQVRTRKERQVWRRRRYERKGGAYSVWMGLQRAVTATFGAATEVQDFIEAFAWNTYTLDGRPAMMAVRQAAFQGRTLEKGDVLGAMAVNARSYAMIFEGLRTGTMRLDVGGALADFGAQQVNDAVIAAHGTAFQKLGNMAGYSHAPGTEALLGTHERNLGIDDLGVNADVSSSLQPYADAFAQRLYWSKDRGFALYGRNS